MPLPRPLRFGVSRSHGGAQPAAAAKRLVEVLATRLGVRVELRIAADYDALTESVLDGKIHLAWMPPLAHARATEKGATLAVVTERRGALTYRSALLVRKDSPAAAVAGLSGVRVAWTDPSSASGYLYARLHLIAAGIDPERDLVSESFRGSSSAALAAVIAGEADLCASYTSEAAAADPALALDDAERVCPGARAQLRVLDVTDSIPPDGVVLGPQLDPEAQARLRDLLLDLHEKPDGLAAISELMSGDRLRGVTEPVLRTIARLRALVSV
ncbi:MAG: phosphate/phosphite/phosphonate ABC transporter substrate-binding protein [Polyangia bacterium]